MLVIVLRSVVCLHRTIWFKIAAGSRVDVFLGQCRSERRGSSSAYLITKVISALFPCCLVYRNERDTCVTECKRQSTRKIVMLVPLKQAAREAEKWRREKEAKRAIITATIKERSERQSLAREDEAERQRMVEAERQRMVSIYGIHRLIWRSWRNPPPASYYYSVLSAIYM